MQRPGPAGAARPFTLQLAPKRAPVAGNGRLGVISHGSGGGPWVHADLASRLVRADFDRVLLVTPRLPLVLVTASADRWRVLAFHSDRVLAACQTCEHLANLPRAGHGALLSPLPPGLPGPEAALLNHPPGFDRSTLLAVDAKSSASSAGSGCLEGRRGWVGGGVTRPGPPVGGRRRGGPPRTTPRVMAAAPACAEDRFQRDAATSPTPGCITPPAV